MLASTLKPLLVKQHNSYHEQIPLLRPYYYKKYLLKQNEMDDWTTNINERNEDILIIKMYGIAESRWLHAHLKLLGLKYIQVSIKITWGR